MEFSDDLRCLFSATVEQQDGSYVIEVPDEELTLGTLQEGRSYRVGVLSTQTIGDEEITTEGRTGREQTRRGSQEVTIEERDVLDVEIEDLGDQGDGIARIGPGFVVFVPDTAVGDHVTIEIQHKQAQFAFGEVVE